MTTPATKPAPKKMPILARHAVSLAIAFVMGMVLSYFAGQYIYQQVQLDKLNSADQATFERGVGYVLTHAGQSDAITQEALDAVATLPPQRAADLLLAVAQSHANRADTEEPVIPDVIHESAASLMQRLDSMQAIGLYDGLIKIKGVDVIKTADALLASLKPKDDAELLQVVDLLDTRLLWSKQWAPLNLWVRWLGVLAQSDSELTQYNTVIRLGDLPDSVDEARISETLNALARSQYERVRNKVLNVVAGYAAIAKDPTDYEQIIFKLGQDENKHIARRAWMIAGHLNPFSGFAVNWKDADPFIAEGMLWAAAKTNPDNPKAVWMAFDEPETQPISLLAMSLLRDKASIEKFDKVVPPVPMEQINIDPERLIAHLSEGGKADATTINLACLSLSRDKERSGPAAQRLLQLNQSDARIIGALVAAMTDARPTLIDGVTADFVTKHPDLTDEKLRTMSDQELSALGLNRTDALTALLDAAAKAPPSANRTAEAKLLRLALWVRGDLGESFTPTAEAMLFDEALPTSTALLGLLHKQRPTALHYLLGSLVTPRPNLHELLVQERFWHVFHHKVPTPDLMLWIDGKPTTQAFQLEAMQQWYAVNRWKIERGWWPGVIDN